MAANAAPTVRPAGITSNPVRRILDDLVAERRAAGPFPPGPSDLSFARGRLAVRDPLALLLPLYERWGPIFSTRLFHQRMVWMLGPEANHYVTVSHPHNFHWRESSFADLIPLIGDGLLTTDDAYHDRARRIMMPAFHREQIASAIGAMAAETDAALDGLPAGEIVDVYGWARGLAMRIAMRALLGLDRDDHGHGGAAAFHFERALGFYGTDFHRRVMRGPGSAYSRLTSSRKALDEIVYGEIARRRERPDSERRDVLSLLLEARDEDGSALADDEIRDQVMTLMFAGHDTSTSTLSFLFYELARHSQVLVRLQTEQDEVLVGATPDAGQLFGRLPYLDMVVDEVLRLYPPAWVGPRRATRPFEFGGYRVPEGSYVNYCSWASHRLPEVFPDPEAFIPERFERSRKAALPRGAYVPFGGGSRICIGKRFGQTEVKLVATLALQRLRFELLPGRTMKIRQMPTLSPDGGLQMRVRERRLACPLPEVPVG